MLNKTVPRWKLFQKKKISLENTPWEKLCFGTMLLKAQVHNLGLSQYCPQLPRLQQYFVIDGTISLHYFVKCLFGFFLSWFDSYIQLQDKFRQSFQSYKKMGEYDTSRKTK